MPTLSKPQTVALYASYFTRLNNLPATIKRDTTASPLVRSILADELSLIQAISTDNTYSINFVEPRLTIVPYSSGTRPYKIKTGTAISYSIGTSGGETSSTNIFSAKTLPAWLSINSATGALTGTAPAITSVHFNPKTGGSVANLADEYPTSLVGVSNDFGQAVNGPYPFTFTVVSASTPVVTSATTLNTAPGATFAYTITANNTPTSFVAYDITTLGALTVTSSTGVIGGTVSSSLATGTYNIYVAGVNAYGEGIDQAVVVTVGNVPVVSSAVTYTTVHNTAFSYSITGTNTPTSYSATGLAALTGVSLNASTGAITGTVTAAAGTYVITVTATNAYGSSVAKTVTVTLT